MRYTLAAMLSRLTVLLCAFSLMWPIAAICTAPSQATEQQTLEIVSKTGVHVFSVELAVTEDERMRGLMFRKELAEGSGMLFDFKSEQDVSMWMKNTYIPLDMFFIRRDGRILHIAENTEPMSETIIPSGGRVLAVLEVPGGTAKRFGIAAGDRVSGPLFTKH
jgi:uncharacterized membrane protein (UPF0127 family)